MLALEPLRRVAAASRRRAPGRVRGDATRAAARPSRGRGATWARWSEMRRCRACPLSRAPRTNNRWLCCRVPPRTNNRWLFVPLVMCFVVVAMSRGCRGRRGGFLGLRPGLSRQRLASGLSRGNGRLLGIPELIMVKPTQPNIGSHLVFPQLKKYMILIDPRNQQKVINENFKMAPK